MYKSTIGSLAIGCLIALSPSAEAEAANLFTGCETGTDCFKMFVVPHDETNGARVYKAFVFKFRYTDETFASVAPIIHISVWGYRGVFTDANGDKIYTAKEKLTHHGPLRGVLQPKETGTRKRDVLGVPKAITIDGEIYQNRIRIRRRTAPGEPVDCVIKAKFIALRSRNLDDTLIMFGKRLSNCAEAAEETPCEEPPVEDILEEDPAIAEDPMDPDTDPVDDLPYTP